MALIKKYGKLGMVGLVLLTSTGMSALLMWPNESEVVAAEPAERTQYAKLDLTDYEDLQWLRRRARLSNRALAGLSW